MLPPLQRIQGLEDLIETKKYFVLHGPFRSGKTTAMMALVDRINEKGSHYALYSSMETLRGIADEDEAMNIILERLNEAISHSQLKTLKAFADASFSKSLDAFHCFSSFPLQIWLRELCTRLDKDLVIVFDEFESLTDDVLMYLLPQLRVSFNMRSTFPFPSSIVFVGTQNIKEYGSKISPGSQSPGTTFNIFNNFLTINNFTMSEIKALYLQHTEASGQIFEESAFQKVWYWSKGQPFMVNALASLVVEEILANDYSVAINEEHIDSAADILMKRGDTHFTF
jgi:hypothetical protein